ncbi:hypothetical protein HHK36_030274 [Tetracentron sinense]|uniref:U3 small nucleolar RNA-associated protein 13 C-terminal domain-containing protein n=1 Tax=Tetracentron sinense TaxID=13715 RepID=A0A835D0I0_TETSI|nr:hypothetical protein HHK36_030274 [Tetracentron sinense]
MIPRLDEAMANIDVVCSPVSQKALSENRLSPRDHLESYTSDYTIQVLVGTAWSIFPGTVFMLLLAGALLGVLKGVVLVVFTATAGASSCYFLSKLIGSPQSVFSSLHLHRPPSSCLCHCQDHRAKGIQLGITLMSIQISHHINANCRPISTYVEFPLKFAATGASASAMGAVWPCLGFSGMFRGIAHHVSFSIPLSKLLHDSRNCFISLLAGALFGLLKSVVLDVFTDTVGASSCYFLSKLVGRPLVFSLWPDKLNFFQAQVVNLSDLRNYGFKTTVPTYEVLETVCVIHPGIHLASCLGSYEQHSRRKKKNVTPPIYFLTVGERGIVRIWSSKGAACLFEQQSSDATVSSDKDGSRRGFTAAIVLPLDQGLLCVTADQQFLVYFPMQSLEEKLELNLSKRLVGYSEEIVDMKFLGEEEHFLAVATNLEQVRVYDLESMSCSYVLAGHTDTVLCLDTCVSSYGRTLLVTGSKNNNSPVVFVPVRSNFFVVLISSNDGSLLLHERMNDFHLVWSLDGLLEDADQAINLKARAVVAAHDKDINSLAVSPNDNLVCSGPRSDRTACLWRLPDLVSIVVLKGHKRGIWSVEFSPVDQCVIIASGDKTIKIWAISDGADGLVKLWTVKTNECMATYDQHDDKVWALTVGKKTEMLATGGSDAVINLWHDSTAADKEEAFHRELYSNQHLLLLKYGVPLVLAVHVVQMQSQEMENALSDADYTKAIQIAFELRRPHKLFDMFAELCRRRNAEKQMEKAIPALGKEEFCLLFEYVREWNTKPKLCHVAQFVLFKVFNVLRPTEIIKISGVGEFLEGLIPYSQRHFIRIDGLIRSTFLLDYTLTGMSVIELETDVRELKDEPVMHSDDKNSNEEPLVESAGEQVRTLVETKKISSKKRKSHKSREGADKKVKEVVFLDASTISLQA